MEVRIGEIDLREVSKGDMLIFEDKRKERVEKIDWKIGNLYTERKSNVFRGLRFIEKVVYDLGFMISPISRGKVYDSYKIIAVNSK